MTDVLNVGHDALDDFTSTQETAPKPAAPTPASATCHFCSSTFEGPARWFQRGRHEKEKHHDEWLAAKAGVKSKAKKPTAKAQPKPKAAPATGRVTGPKRVNASETIARNLGRVAKLVAQVDVPLGRALVFSAPATGQAVDELVAGTVVDRMVLQKFAGAADKWEKFGGVIAFPVLIAVVSRNPALYDVLEDDLREATLDVIISSIPTLEKQKAKEKKAVDALRRLGQVDERYANTDDPIGLILRDLFATPTRTDDDGEAQ
jgi:hypothetical protein